MTQHLLNGDELVDPRKGESKYVVMSRIPFEGQLKVFDKEKNAERHISYAQLREDIGTGALRIVRPGAPAVSGIYQRDDEYNGALAEAFKIARAVIGRAAAKKISFCQAYVDIAGTWTMSDPTKPFPARSTVYRYLERERRGLPLLKSQKNKGNRTPRRSPRITEIVIQELKDKHQREGSRWSIKNVTLRVNQLLHDERLLPKHDNVSRKYVDHVLREHVATDPEIARMDPRLVGAAKSVARHTIRVPVPLMRVEQDALHIPWDITTPYGKTNSIYLIHAVDCATGMPLGWMLVIGAPTVRDTLRCLETVLFSKKARLAQLGIETAYDFYGTPSSLVVDNGGENIGQRLPLLAHIGIDAWRCKANQGQEKPFIERLNLSLKEALEVLPGCTRFDGVDGKRDTERLGDANMTLEQLEYWIVSWYYKFWANQKLERHVHAVFTDLVHFGNTPATRWKRMVDEHGFALPLPPNPAAWRTLFFERAERTLCRKTGITYEGFHFRGANLPYLIAKYGEERVPILVDPDDFRRIYVQDGSDEDLIELINASVNEVTPAYSFQAGKAKLIETWGSDEGNREEAENFNREKFANASSSNGKPAKKLSKPKQSRETTQAAKHGQAVHRAADNPLPPVLPVADSGVPFISFDEAPVLPVLNRTTGQQQEP